MSALTDIQQRGLREYIENELGRTSCRYVAEKDEDHDGHTFVRIFHDDGTDDEIVIEGDGSITR